MTHHLGLPTFLSDTPHGVDITHTFKRPHTTHLINIKKFKPLKTPRNKEILLKHETQSFSKGNWSSLSAEGRQSWGDTRLPQELPGFHL